MGYEGGELCRIGTTRSLTTFWGVFHGVELIRAGNSVLRTTRRKLAAQRTCRKMMEAEIGTAGRATPLRSARHRPSVVRLVGRERRRSCRLAAIEAREPELKVAHGARLEELALRRR